MTARVAAAPTPGLWPVKLVFMMEAVSLGAWLPRIPDIKASLDMDAGTLGLVLLGVPVGTMVGFIFAAGIAGAIGLRRSCMIAGTLFALTYIPMGFAPTPLALFAVLAVTGVVVALLEVAMNTKAGELERTSGRRVMSQCHGFWSIGTVIGALVGGLVAQAGIPVATQFLMLNPLFAVIALAVAWMMPRDHGGDAPRERQPFFALPGRALVILCLMPVGIMGLEGAMMDWSAVFVREVLLAEPFEAAMVYAAFSAVMAITRLAGDRLAERFGAARIVLVSSISAAVGAAMFATAPDLIVAMAGAVLAGFGVATVYPLAVSAAAASPGRSPEANVAAVSFIAFSVFLVGPPLIGGLADLFGLRIALALLVPAALVSAAMSGSVRVGDRQPVGQ